LPLDSIYIFEVQGRKTFPCVQASCFRRHAVFPSFVGH
jgi:hypothetical protein